MKKSKFSSLVKIKRSKLQEIERELIDVQNRKKKVESQIALTREKIKSFNTPKDGKIASFQLSKENFSLMIEELEELKQRLEIRKKQISSLRQLYKEADMELEKFLALEDEEVQKMLDLAKRLESKEMDEIANILNLRNRLKEEV
jgi:flagellar biosynthesis chaperone FliJ